MTEVEHRTTGAADADALSAGNSVAPPISPEPDDLILIAAEDAYWTVISAQEAERLGSAVAYRFEQDLPIPLEDVQVATCELASGAVVLLGVPRSELHQRWTASPSARRALPRDLPPFVQAAGAQDADRLQLNLLTGAFEPSAVRRERQRRRVILISLLSLLLLGAIVGVERRVARGWADVATLDARATTALAAAIPPGSGSSQRADLQLVQELRRIDQELAATGQHPEAVVALDAVLRAVPPATSWRITELTSDASGVHAQGWVASAAEAQQVQRAFGRQLTISAGGTTAGAADAVLVADAPTLSPEPGGGLSMTFTWHWRDGSR